MIFNTNLVRGRVQPQQVIVAPLQACLCIAVVHVFCSCAFKHRGQESVWGGVLQVKDTGGPAPPRSLIKADRPPLCVILNHARVRGRSEITCFYFLTGKDVTFKCSLQMFSKDKENNMLQIPLPYYHHPFNMIHMEIV